MKELFEIPELEIISFESEDILTVSPTEPNVDEDDDELYS